MQFLNGKNSFYLVQTSSQCMQTGNRHLKKDVFRLVFLYFLTELKTYHLSYFYLQTLRYRHTDPSSMQEADVESLWLGGRASEREIRRSEVRIFIGTQNYFFVPRSWQDEEHLSVFLYQVQNLPSLLLLSTDT